jgi:U3 small nucleolar RNA-associated protein 14
LCSVGNIDHINKNCCKVRVQSSEYSESDSENSDHDTCSHDSDTDDHDEDDNDDRDMNLNVDVFQSKSHQMTCMFEYQSKTHENLWVKI